MIGRLGLLAACVALTATACGSPPPPDLATPAAIVAAMVKASEAARTTHIEAVVDGTTPIAMPGSQAAIPIPLDGTTASVDVDLANGAGHATFAVPAMLNLAGEFLAVGGKAYYKTTLTGSTYTTIDLGIANGPGAPGASPDASPSGDPADPASRKNAIDALGAFLSSDKVHLVKGDDVACGPARCYTLVTDLTADELAALGQEAGGAVPSGAIPSGPVPLPSGLGFPGGLPIPADLPIDLSGASLHLVIRVEQSDPHHLAGVRADLSKPGDAKPLSVDLTFSKWDQVVTIAPPPPDEITGG